MKVVRPRVTGPLAFSGLDGGLIFFSGLFCLVMHSKINYQLLFKQSKNKSVRKADSGAGLLHAPHVGSYLPFLGSNSSLAGLYTTLKKTNGYTLSPATAPKCRAIKRVSFTSNYLTLICQPESVLSLQRVTQSEAHLSE